jgi:hypothetical protein
VSRPSFQFSRSYLECLNNSLECVNSRCPLSSGLGQLSIVFLELTNSGRMLRRNGLNLLPMVFLDFIDPGSSLRRGVGEFAVMLFERHLSLLHRQQSMLLLRECSLELLNSFCPLRNCSFELLNPVCPLRKRSFELLNPVCPLRKRSFELLNPFCPSSATLGQYSVHAFKFCNSSTEKPHVRFLQFGCQCYCQRLFLSEITGSTNSAVHLHADIPPHMGRAGEVGNALWPMAAGGRVGD